MITSRNNPKIKNIVKLNKVSERRKQNLFVIEGEREISRALQAKISIQLLYVCPAIATGESVKMLVDDIARGCEIETVSKDVFEKMAYRQNSDGLIAVAHLTYSELSDVRLSENPLLIVLEGIEKPGNLGAVLRTADAAGVDAVIISDPQSDIYNPNVIRSSLGCIFTVQVAVCSTAAAISWLQKNHIRIFATSPDASEIYTKSDFKKPSAIVMGAESPGLSDQWLNIAGRRINIPMKGISDSLNVSTSTAIVVFEAVRQRESSSVNRE